VPGAGWSILSFSVRQGNVLEGQIAIQLLQSPRAIWGDPDKSNTMRRMSDVLSAFTRCGAVLSVNVQVHGMFPPQLRF
jgi:hypothetical protein